MYVYIYIRCTISDGHSAALLYAQHCMGKNHINYWFLQITRIFLLAMKKKPFGQTVHLVGIAQAWNFSFTMTKINHNVVGPQTKTQIYQIIKTKSYYEACHINEWRPKKQQYPKYLLTYCILAFLINVQ